MTIKLTDVKQRISRAYETLKAQRIRHLAGKIGRLEYKKSLAVSDMLMEIEKLARKSHTLKKIAGQQLLNAVETTKSESIKLQTFSSLSIYGLLGISDLPQLARIKMGAAHQNLSIYIMEEIGQIIESHKEDILSLQPRHPMFSAKLVNPATHPRSFLMLHEDLKNPAYSKISEEQWKLHAKQLKALEGRIK